MTHPDWFSDDYGPALKLKDLVLHWIDEINKRVEVQENSRQTLNAKEENFEAGRQCSTSASLYIVKEGQN